MFVYRDTAESTCTVTQKICGWTAEEHVVLEYNYCGCYPAVEVTHLMHVQWKRPIFSLLLCCNDTAVVCSRDLGPRKVQKVQGRNQHAPNRPMQSHIHVFYHSRRMHRTGPLAVPSNPTPPYSCRNLQTELERHRKKCSSAREYTGRAGMLHLGGVEITLPVLVGKKHERATRPSFSVAG